MNEELDRLRAENERLRTAYAALAPAAIEQRERADRAEAALAKIGQIPDVFDRAGVGAGAVYDAVIALTGALATAKKDAELGWSAFYALRKTIAEDKYPHLTNIVRALAQKESGNG